MKKHPITKKTINKCFYADNHENKYQSTKHKGTQIFIFQVGFRRYTLGYKTLKPKSVHVIFY